MNIWCWCSSVFQVTAQVWNMQCIYFTMCTVCTWHTGKLLYIEIVRTEEKFRDIRGFEKLKLELVTIVTSKHFVLFHTCISSPHLQNIHPNPNSNPPTWIAFLYNPIERTLWFYMRNQFKTINTFVQSYDYIS